MGNKQRVLVLDDDESILKVLSDALKLEGFEVDTAYDGEDGLSKVTSFKPDYAIVDCLMPRMDGFEFIKEIRNNPSTSRMKIIMMSAVFTDRPFVKEAMSTYQPEAFLEKPFEVKDVLKVLTGSSSQVGAPPVQSRGPEEDPKTLLKKGFKKKGSLETTSVSHLLYCVAALDMTGVLTVERDKNKWVLYFYRGIVVKTVSNVFDEYFGTIAVELGYISEKDKESCIKAAAVENSRIGDMMVKRCGLNPKAILDILRVQGEKRINSLVRSDVVGTYLYQQAVVNKAPKVYLKIDIVNYFLTTLLSGEVDFFESQLDPFMQQSPVINKNSVILGVRLSFEPWHKAILQNINGSLTVQNILNQFPNIREKAVRYLWGLHELHGIMFSEDVKKSNTINFYRNQLELLSNSNYFDVLGISQNAGDGDVKKAYTHMAKEYHPDKNIHYNSEELNAIVKQIFDLGSKAYQELSTSAGREKYLKLLEQNPHQVSVEQVMSEEGAFTEGLRYFKKNMIEKAKDNFKKAYEANPNNLEYSGYYAYMLLLESQINKSKKIDPVQKIIQKNLAEDISHEVSNLVAGYMYKYLGKNDDALSYFERVTEANDNNIDAQRELRLLRKRKGKKTLFGIPQK